MMHQQPGSGMAPQQAAAMGMGMGMQYQQQQPNPYAMMGQPPPQQQQQPMWAPHHYQQPQPGSAQMPASASADEVRTLWIGDLQYWMEETYISSCFAGHAHEIANVKVIRNKLTGNLEGYGFVEFTSHAAAERVLQTYNGMPMPNVEQTFRLNWASHGGGEKRDDGPDYTIFVGDLAADVTDQVLQDTFKVHYPSVKGAKVVLDRVTQRTKGYGFVRFSDESEQMRAMNEMNGQYCSSRPMRIGQAANKKPLGTKASDQSPQSQTEQDPSNTTIFVGNLDPNATDEDLRSLFGRCGQLVHVKIPAGKRCGFVQFAERRSAEEALENFNGAQLCGQSVRLSWGRNFANKQPQQETSQWNGQGGYYNYGQGYGQGYENYGYGAPAAAAAAAAPPPQDPSMYYGNYAGYGGYQQPQQQPQQPSQHQQQQAGYS